MRFLIPWCPLAPHIELVRLDDKDLPPRVGFAVVHEPDGIEVHVDLWRQTLLIWFQTTLSPPPRRT